MPTPPQKRPTTKRASRRVQNSVSTRGANVVPGLLSVFPERLVTSLDYVDTLEASASSTAGTFGTEFAYRLNSLFDPYFSLGGHQPFGFDQIATFYNRYMVNAVDIEVIFSDPSTDGVVAGAYLKNFYDTSTLSGSTVSAASERPTNWVKPLNNTGSQVAVFRKHVDLAAMMGLTKAQYEGGWFALSGLVTTDPAQSPYLAVAAANYHASSSATVQVQIKIRYHSVFWGRKMPGQS